MYHYLECGLPNVYLVNGYNEKETPYGPSVSFVNVKGLHEAIGLDIINKSEVLNKDEIRFLRKELGWSQVALGQTLGVREVTVRKWESGENKINPPADRLLKAIYKDFVDPSTDVSKFVEQIASLDNMILKAMKDIKLEMIDDNWNRKRA